jgi:hypothetical protein
MFKNPITTGRTNELAMNPWDADQISHSVVRLCRFEPTVRLSGRKILVGLDF